MILRETYDLICMEIGDYEQNIDSYPVVETVDKLRDFFRPDKNDLKLILLAESHNSTHNNKYEHGISEEHIEEMHDCFNFHQQYPNKFVQFVNCIGYGESEIVEPAPNFRNSGTVQYWELFQSCFNDPENPNFYYPNKSIYPDVEVRCQSKRELLKKLKDRGIWLVDASIVGVNQTVNEIKFHPGHRETITKLSWKHYIKNKLRDIEEDFRIVTIGYRIHKILEMDPFYDEHFYGKIIQPNYKGFGSSDERKANLKRLYDKCNEVIRA